MAYELSREFWLCKALMERLNLPFQLREKEMDDEIWFCRASVTSRELYRLLDGLEKLTDAVKLMPGRAFESWECDHCRPKLRLWKKSVLPFSPVWSLE